MPLDPVLLYNIAPSVAGCARNTWRTFYKKVWEREGIIPSQGGVGVLPPPTTRSENERESG